MAGTLGMHLGKFSLTTAVATAPAVTVGGVGVSLTAADYYLAGGGDTQLAEHLQAQIRAIAGGSQDTATVVLNSTPRFVVTLKTSATLALNASFATVLGFTSTSYSSATVFTAEQSPRYCWAPIRTPSYAPGNTPPLWMPRLGTIYGRAPDGTSWSVVRPTVYDAELEYVDLPKEDVITPTTGTVYRDFQTWFVDVIGAGKSWRYVYDKTDYLAASDYFESTWNADGEEVGGLMDVLDRRVRSYLGLFSVRLPLAKKI